MSCKNCVDEAGVCAYPLYGVGPHTHDLSEGWIGSTVLSPKEQWPENFQEDAECPGLGTWWCAECGEGKP